MDKMEKVVIPAKKRNVVGKQVKALRREGLLPAVIYGYAIEPTPIVLDSREATRTLSQATSSSLITIELEGSEFPSLVREKQRDFIRGDLLHIDFQALSLTERIRANVSIELDGVAPAVKEFNAIIVSGLTELEVECLPGDLPEMVTVDISSLVELGSAIYVSDVNLPGEIEILNDPEAIIAVATALKEEEAEEEEELEELEEPEVIERGKKDEDEEEEE